MLRPMGHAHPLQRGRHALLSFTRIHPAIRQRQLNVFIDGEVADQIETLKDETHFAIADARTLGQRKVLNRLVIEDVLAIAGRIEQTENR